MGEVSNKSLSETSFLLARTKDDDKHNYSGNGWQGHGQAGEKESDDSVLDTKAKQPVEGDKIKFSNLPRRERTVLILCTVAQFLTGFAFAQLGPFYPVEASKRGASPTVIGLIFGCYNVVIFISAPIFGSQLAHLGPKFVYLSGIFVAGASTVIFGFLDRCPDGVPFIATSFLCRSIAALGASAFSTSSFAIVSSEFPDNVGTAFGILETGFGIGYVTGPGVGGALYDLGGFGVPFYLTGGLILLNGILMYGFLPEITNFHPTRKRSFFVLLKNPLVVLPMFSVLAGLFGISAFDTTFARHFDKFKLSTTIIGLFFMIAAGTYSIMAPILGFITDSKDILAPLIIGGHVVFGVGFLVIGPSFLLPFIPYELWTMGVGPVLLGISLGCTLIPTMKCMVKGALEMHFDNNLDTYGMVSGLFNSVNCLGGFLGPVVTGSLIENYDYSTAYTAVAMLHFLMAILSFVFFLSRWLRMRRKGSDFQPVPDEPVSEAHDLT